MNLRTIFLMLWLCQFALPAQAACTLEPNANIVLLKLDDVTNVSAKWQKITDYLESNQIAASFGVIGDSLENDNPSYFSWLKKRVEVDVIELWNHGYHSNFAKNKATGILGEFDGTTADLQTQSLTKTQSLAKQKIGIALHGFGPHNSALDGNSYLQLDQLPEIQYVWFYVPKDQLIHQAFVFQRVANLEHPIFHPNAAAFMQDYLNRPKNLGYIAIQGHPNMWDDQDFENFVRIIDFLRSEKATFCKPSQVIANVRAGA